ncbi:hypothetical protein WA158_006032 [Blastocystis sp. Blastoise]
MKFGTCVSLLVLLLVNVAFAEKWAVLVCGSEGYWNYRHQADNAHAYRILINNGYKPENIIVFSINDAPSYKYNPIPNTLYNKPGNSSIDYYENYVVDYEGEACNVDNYIKVLTGDESAGGKVLKTTEEDTVFLTFFDHGDDDIICFPKEDLHSTDLLFAFRTMKEKKMYKRIVYYMEACFSGSMFKSLESDLNVYALTAANDNESSWGWYCGNDAVVNGIPMKTCLGDEFSIRWMENVDEGDLNQTFKQHAETIQTLVVKSHVSRYGDFSFENLPISEVFTGDLATVKNRKVIHNEIVESASEQSHLSKLHFFEGLLQTNSDNKEIQEEYKKELETIGKVDTYFDLLIKKFKRMGVMPLDSIRGPVKNVECYKKTTQYVNKYLGRSDYLLKYYHTLHTICDQYSDAYLYM